MFKLLQKTHKEKIEYPEERWHKHTDLCWTGQQWLCRYNI